MKRIILYFVLLNVCFAQAYASKLWVAPFDIKAGETKAVDIYLTMDSEGLYAGFQFDMYLPEGLEVVRNDSGDLRFQLKTNRLTSVGASSEWSHQLTSNFADGYYTILVSSPTNNTLKDTQGAVITMYVKASEDMHVDKFTASMKDIKLGKPTASSDNFASEPFDITTMKELRLVLGTNGYSTYACDYNFKMISGASAYTGSYSAGNVTLMDIEEDAVIPAGDGVMLWGSEGENVILLATGEDAAALQDNDFVGVTRQTESLKPGNNYVLASLDEDNFFALLAKNETVESLMNKAYINVWEEKPEFITINGNFPDGLTVIANNSENDDAVFKYLKDGKVLIRNKDGIYSIGGIRKE